MHFWYHTVLILEYFNSSKIDGTQCTDFLRCVHNNTMKWVSHIDFCITNYTDIEYGVFLNKKQETATQPWLPAWRYLKFKQTKAGFAEQKQRAHHTAGSHILCPQLPASTGQPHSSKERVARLARDGQSLGLIFLSWSALKISWNKGKKDSNHLLSSWEWTFFMLQHTKCTQARFFFFFFFSSPCIPIVVYTFSIHF